MATAAAAILAKARRDVVGHFMTCNAVSPASAIAYEPSTRVQRRMFDRLQRDGVLVAAADNRWFIDIPRYHESVSTRRKRVLGVLGAAILAAAGLALMG
ncbi:hypothetical protein LPN01_18770 [Sphingomonas sp. A2-49]|uniref:hypothetical protein n=1 Tax=Sphingomonas sp. A2-49 TaxID=1391375 RepID=UPI0021D3CB48|nr:hypothetical protein [Sphingomonas sp. A2-49]MCU6456126.1 hypothetical protein [Sphingomonas sp. A2-49]